MNGAIALVMSARATDPDDLELMAWHALLLSKRGQDAAAIPLLERLITSIDINVQAPALAMLAVCYDTVGRGADAMETARAALAVDPTRIPPATTLGLRLVEAGKVEEALAVLERALPHAKKPKQRESIEKLIAVARAKR
ncbi:MAG TPA: hypothetical protein VGM90_39720 [Kofleriaceae bacterium]